MLSISSILSAGLLAAGLATAIPNAQPAPTRAWQNDIMNIVGMSPKPTEAPSMEFILKRAPYLVGRQAASLSSGQLVGYFAPDSQCGYISGSLGAPIPCSTGSRCAAIAPIGNLPGAVGCCPVGKSGCYFITTCYNSAEIAASKCDHGCQQDSDVRLCSASTRPYCYGYSWPDISATIWGCDSVSVTTKDLVSFLFNGESSTRSWSAFYYTPSGTGSATGILSDVTNRVSSASASQSSSASPSPTPPPASKSNTGAIVGGVVGGIAVLGAFGFGIFFLLMRKRRQQKEATANPPQPVQPGQPGMQQQQMYNPNQPSPNHMNAVPVGAATAGYFGQENKPPMNEMGFPHQSPPQGYPQPAKYDQNGQYIDPRVSTYSEASSNPVPPYQGPPSHMQPPMELDATSAPYRGPGGQPVYEAPADVPGNK